MLNKPFAICTSLFALCAADAANAAIRVGNSSRSYADSYQQVVRMQQMAEEANPVITTEQAIEALPVRVADPELARALAEGGRDARTTDPQIEAAMESLERCSLIYLDGKFAWDKPNAGVIFAGSGATCVAEVEMRLIYGNKDIVLARAMVAAGDSIDCNISRFPPSGYTADAGKITFPADRPPTRDEVARVMNEEQKQNAALKTVAALAIGGVGGYLMNRNEPNKWSSAAVGAGAMGGITYTSTQIGKTAGDTLMGATVNAAAGGLMVNMMGVGGSALLVRNCDVGTTGKCLWGMIEQKIDLEQGKTAYYNFLKGDTMVCDDNPPHTCISQRIIGANVIRKAGNPWTIEEMIATPNFDVELHDDTNRNFCLDENNNREEYNTTRCPGGRLYKLEGGGKPGRAFAAAIPWNEKFFGSSGKDWAKWRNENLNNSAQIHVRTGDKVEGPISESTNEYLKHATVRDFFPLYVDASDGSIIDFNNRARLKATMIGAGAGAALGGFSAYQGAQDDIENRWVASVQEYKDSLQKIYCATGNRFLASYNDIAIISAMK